jgi:hypothetical protein
MGEPTENEHENELEEPEASEPTKDVPTTHSASSPPSIFRWLAAAALLVALSALGISLWVLLRPPTTSSPAESPAPSTQQIADAKTRACGAYATVRTAVNLRTNADPGPDPASVQAEGVAANARQALTVGNSYLLSRLDPATPAPLAAAIRKFADESQEVAINALAGANTDDPAQAGRINDFAILDGQIVGLCK